MWDLLFDTFGTDVPIKEMQKIISNNEKFSSLPATETSIKTNRNRYRNRHPDARELFDAKKQKKIEAEKLVYANFIPSLKKLFIEFGGNSLNKNDIDYVKNICLIARRVRYMQKGRPKTPIEKPFLQDDNSVFYDFYQVYLACAD